MDNNTGKTFFSNLQEYVESLEMALKFYAQPENYEKGYVPVEYNDGGVGFARASTVKTGLLTDPPVIQDGGKIAREALA